MLDIWQVLEIYYYFVSFKILSLILFQVSSEIAQIRVSCFFISGTIAFREKAYILISYAWWGELKFRNKELGKQNVLTSHIVTNNGWSWDHNRFCQ